MSTETLVGKFQALPPAARKRVEALIEDLSAKQVRPGKRKKKRFTFNWAGGLSDLKGQFTAVELQHHINELR